MANYFTLKDAQELDGLMALRNRRDLWMTQGQQDRLSQLRSKMYHNHCLHPHCSGYVAKSEKEIICRKCLSPLYKSKTPHV